MVFKPTALYALSVFVALDAWFSFGCDYSGRDAFKLSGAAALALVAVWWAAWAIWGRSADLLEIPKGEIG